MYGKISTSLFTSYFTIRWKKKKRISEDVISPYVVVLKYLLICFTTANVNGGIIKIKIRSPQDVLW